MPKKYLIGIGGTGARVIEAAVFMCAAGFGPDELSVFLIDPDEGNGNLSRTKTLLSLYKQCKDAFQPSQGTKLLKTKITTPNPFVWNIFKDQNETLADRINYKNYRDEKNPIADLASVLFSGGDGEESGGELNTKLNEGFRGHPSIGALVMSDPSYKDKDPWKTFWDDISVRTQPNDVSVFLVGSIFGGTGAAGVATIGSRKFIKFNENAKLGENQSKVLLGGALVLPYFTFKVDKSVFEGEMFVTPNDFPIATKAALQYYNEKVLGDNLGFDHLYFIGDSLGQNVGKFSPGSRTQANLPHYIEIVTALSAYDFFEQAVQGVPEKRYFIACREDERVRWNSLPVAHDERTIEVRQKELKSRIVSMTAFAYSMCTFGKEILEKEDKKIKIGETWYKDITNNFKYRLGDNKEMLGNFYRLSEQFLSWICSIDEEDGKVDLIDRKKFTDSEIEVGESFKINLIRDYNKYSFNMGNFLKGEPKNSPLQFFKFQFLLTPLAKDLTAREKTMRAADRFINIFYEGATDFCEKSYGIAK